MVGRRGRRGGIDQLVVSASMTTGHWGHCFSLIHTHRHIEETTCVEEHRPPRLQ